MLPVCQLLEQARKTNDVIYLLRAYTKECSFCYSLNKALAERVRILD